MPSGSPLQGTADREIASTERHIFIKKCSLKLKGELLHLPMASKVFETSGLVGEASVWKVQMNQLDHGYLQYITTMIVVEFQITTPHLTLTPSTWSRASLHGGSSTAPSRWSCHLSSLTAFWYILETIYLKRIKANHKRPFT